MGEVVPDYAASTMQMGRSGEVMIQGHVLALKNVWKSLTERCSLFRSECSGP